MNSILLVTFTILAISQLCGGAAVPKTENNNSLEKINDTAIDFMAETFLLLPTSNKEKVGILANVLKRINNNMTSAEQDECGTELMYLAISNKDSTLTLAEWKRVINESIEEQTSNETTSSSSEEGFTITKLIEEKLSGIVTSEEAKRITATLNGLRNHASSAESNAAMYDLFVSSIVNTLGVQPDGVKNIFNNIQINDISNKSSVETNTI